MSLFLAWPSLAQVAAPPGDKPALAWPPAPEDPLGRETPHGTVLGFIRAADSGNYARATRYLDVRANPGAGPDLARQLSCCP